MHVAIDASNINSGGGLAHLQQILHAAEPEKSGVKKVTVWTSLHTANLLPQRSWLQIESPTWCNCQMPIRITGQHFLLPFLVKKAGCDILFSPGGSLPSRVSIPTVTMSQNMLPFEASRADLFGRISIMRFKLAMLRYSQATSFERANGLIFLTDYARVVVTNSIAKSPTRTVLIPHGIEARFFVPPRPTKKLSECNSKNPFKLLYVSIQMPYKHQAEVVLAVATLRQQGLPIELTLAGSPWGKYGASISNLIGKLDNKNTYLKNLGNVTSDKLPALYQNADAFIFASSCENLPNILLEAMAASLPIACSKFGPMKEIIGNASMYFDPELPKSIAHTVKALALDFDLREELSAQGLAKAHTYSWSRSARQTFDFIADVANHHNYL